MTHPVAIRGSRRLWVQIDSPENVQIAVRGKPVHVRTSGPASGSSRRRVGTARRAQASTARGDRRLGLGARARRPQRPQRPVSSPRRCCASASTRRASPSSATSPPISQAALAEGLVLRPALRLGRPRPDPRRPHDRAAGRGGRRRAARRSGAARRRSRSSRAGSRSASGGRTPTSRTASRKQATLPDGALWVGLVGTAPAVVLEAGGCVAVALPGPPRELQELWPRVLETEPLRRAARAGAAARSARVLRFYGVSESAVAQSLAAAGGDGDGVDVTICARDFEMHVDLFAHPGAEQRARALADALVADSSAYLFSREEVGTAELVLDLLRERGLSLATAESCTGGLVAGRLTDVPGLERRLPRRDRRVRRTGSSTALLGVDASLLAAHGAVSAEVAAAMARGARERARRRRRRLGHGRRRARGRDGGEAGRARLPARVGADGRARPAVRASRATARRSAAAPRSRRCTSCGDSSRSRDRHVTRRPLAWVGMSVFASSARCSSPTRRSRRLAAWQREHLQPGTAGGRVVPAENLHITLVFLGSRPAGRGAGDRSASCAARPTPPSRPTFELRRYRETPRRRDARARRRPA